jgi:hypothetical protein
MAAANARIGYRISHAWLAVQQVPAIPWDDLARGERTRNGQAYAVSSC